MSTSARSPWLDVPLADYESHMSLPAIAQADFVARRFADVLHRFRPESVAVIGCAGGNGFDRIDPAVTKRTVGVDLNPGYIATASARWLGRIPGLEFHVADVESDPLPFAAVDLIHAALLFEYVAMTEALRNLALASRPGGRLVAVLQRPSPTMPEVTPSPYTSLQALAPIMRLVPPDDLAARAAAVGFVLESSQIEALPSGKDFVVQVYLRQQYNTNQG